MQLATIRIPSFDLELIKVTGQFSYPWHCHTKTWVIGAVISGKATLVTAESTRQPKWFVIPPLTGHALQTASQSTTITASLGPDTLRKAGPGTALDTIAKAFAQADWPANLATALAPALALATAGIVNKTVRPPWLAKLL
ncbi:MAG: hypothetical protein FWG16_07225, partial [Micrococcales bacterium]|nr:hypothetical protein [Micrococcales bacterium]